MKSGISVLVTMVAASVLTVSAYAIDAGSVVIDTLGAEGTSADNAGSVAGSIISEIGVKVPTEDWAVIAGITYRSVDLDGQSGNYEGWGGELGAKYYFTRQTSLALVGSFEEYDFLAYADVTSVNLRFKQRFTPAQYGVSPYVNLAIAARFADYKLGENNTSENNPNDYLLKAGLGSDFMITKCLAIVFDVSYAGTFDSFGNIGDMGDADGWMGSVAFTSYWE